MRQNRFKSVAGLVGSLGTKQNDKSEFTKEVVALQAELSKERQHSREQAERIAVLADQAQQIEDCVAPAEPERQQPEPPRSWWSRFWSK